MTVPSLKDMAIKRLAYLEAEYKKGGRPREPLKDAFRTCTRNNIPLPEWVIDGLFHLFDSPHLDRLLSTFEKAYKAGNYGALKDAVYWCGKYNLPLPEWVNFALFDTLNSLAKDDKEILKKWRTWFKQYKQDIDDYEVYEWVVDAREHGAEWKDVYGIAGSIISNKMEEDGGTKSNTIEKTYKRVVQRLKDNAYRYLILRTFLKRKVIQPFNYDLWVNIEKTIKAGKPKGIKNNNF